MKPGFWLWLSLVGVFLNVSLVLLFWQILPQVVGIFVISAALCLTGAVGNWLSLTVRERLDRRK